MAWGNRLDLEGRLQPTAPRIRQIEALWGTAPGQPKNAQYSMPLFN
jgi:hypothetical protein